MSVYRFDAIFDGQIMLNIQIVIRLCQHSINLQFYQLFYLFLFVYYSYSDILAYILRIRTQYYSFIIQMNKSKTGIKKNEPVHHNTERNGKIKKNIIRKVYNKEDRSLCLFGYKSNWLDIFQDQTIDWKNLTNINLGKCGITDSSAKGLIKLKVPSIQCLYLQFNSLSAAGVKSIFQNDFPELKCVVLSHNKIQSGGLQKLTESIKNKITILSLENCNISGIGLKFMPNSNLKNLTELVLSDNKIGLVGIKYLRNVNMPCLQKLYVQNCEIGNQGAKHLSKGKWANIQHLLLRNNYIRSDGLEKIKLMQVRHSKIISVQMEDPITIMNMMMIDCSCSIPKQVKNRKMNNDMNALIQGRFLVEQDYY